MTPIEISIVLLTFIAMEGVVWGAHKFLMHGIYGFSTMIITLRLLVPWKRMIRSF